MIRIDILGSAIRQHLHLQPGDRMPSVLRVSSPFNTHSTMGVSIAGPARVCYDPSAVAHDEAWIETEAPVTSYEWPVLLPPKQGATLIHLNSNHQRANRYALREATGAEEKQTLLVRMPNGEYERAWRTVETTGPSWIVLACKENGVDPQPCGAMLWLQTYDEVLLDHMVVAHQAYQVAA